MIVYTGNNMNGIPLQRDKINNTIRANFVLLAALLYVNYYYSKEKADEICQ